MRNRELVAASFGAIVLMVALLLMGWRYENDAVRPVADIAPGRLEAATFAVGGLPGSNEDQPFPWTDEREADRAILSDLDRMIGDATLLAVDANPLINFRTNAVHLYFASGQAMLTPGWRCESRLYSQECFGIHNAVGFTPEGGPSHLLYSPELADWFADGWRKQARFGDPLSVGTAQQQLWERYSR